MIREGTERSLPAAEVVPGDLLVVREGDRVSADARIFSAERLAVDESLLTGESAPVEKDTEAVPTGLTAERNSMLYAGTGVTRGRATVIVTATGPRTELGRTRISRQPRRRCYAAPAAAGHPVAGDDPARSRRHDAARRRDDAAAHL